jgi:Ser/Thr protein kinase RdoA (MazF antagonist)
MHRHEADVNPLLPRVAPRLLWRAEAEGWLLLGFEHVAGRHIDLAPGSPDLPMLADAAVLLADELVDSPTSAPPLGDQWARLAAWRRLAKDTPRDLDEWARANLDHLVACETSAIDLVRGDSLVHTDLHSLNILVSHSRVRVVDWAWSRKGAPSVDVAFLIIRLIAAGHTAAAAEQWANTMPLWRLVPAATQTAFAVAIWGMWEFLERDKPMPHRGQLTEAARSWSRHRLR